MNEDRCRALEAGIGRVISCLRSVVAKIIGRAKESIGVLEQRFSREAHLVPALLLSAGLQAWERSRRPYSLA